MRVTSPRGVSERQLSLPGWRAPLKRVYDRTLRGALELRVEVRSGAFAVELSLDARTPHAPPGDFWHRAVAFVITIELAPEPRCLVNGQPSWWCMTPHVEGPFALAMRMAHELLEYAEPTDDPTRPGPAQAIVGEACRLTAELAIARCDLEMRERVLPLASSTRLFAYAALVADPSGRVAQLLAVCPGVFTLAAGDPSAEARLLIGAREGHPLPAIVRDVLALVRLDELHRDAVVLVRRAPPSLRRLALREALGAAGCDINDMPTSPAAREIWFAWVHESSGAMTTLDVRDRTRLGSFVSKHALALEAIAVRRGVDRPTLLLEILDWVDDGRGTIPSRTSSPTRVLAAVDAWHEHLWQCSSQPDPARELPEGPTSVEDVAGVEILPIRTVGDLLLEGRTMHHCVGSYAGAALAGELYFYRAAIHGDRLTLAIGRSGGRWHLVEAAGFANSRPRDRSAIQQWLDGLSRVRDP